jgi:mannitol-specific phosphotransferase system IIBC component
MIERNRSRPADNVAGLLAAAALFLGLLELVYRPFRLAPAALILGLIATGMSARWQRLALAAVLTAGACWVAGMTIAVLTHHPLY